MIKVGYCVAYDWYFLKHSIPRIYENADLICLSIDINRRSWSGKSFDWDQEGFESLIRDLDVAGKIKVYEEDFSLPDLAPMENEVRQRNMMANFMGKGGWHIQLDADEYFLDFAGFTAYLKGIRRTTKVNVCCPWINLYKQLPNGFLWIKPHTFSQIEYIQVATTEPYYEYGRRNGYFNILTEFSLLHQSWARSEEEILHKLSNWGHSRDFDVSRYFQMWKEVNEHNFHRYKNFHHLRPESWPELQWVEGTSVASMLDNGLNSFELPIRKSDLILANSIWYSRLKKVLHINTLK